MPMPMDQIESLRLQGAYHGLRPGFRNFREEIVEFDTKLLDWNSFRKAGFQHLILEAFNINLQQVDGVVPIDRHLVRETRAGQRLATAGF